MEKYIVETSRLILRPFTMKDLNEYFEITREKEIKMYVPYACPQTHKDCERDFITSYTVCDFVHDFYVLIERKATRKVIGAIICTLSDEFDVAYFISKLYREHGYMREALQAFVQSMPKGSILRFDIKQTNTASLHTIKSIETAVEYEFEDSEKANFRRFIITR